MSKVALSGYNQIRSPGKRFICNNYSVLQFPIQNAT